MATQKKFFADTGLETSSSLQVDGNATIDGNTTITGNLTVNGTSLTVNATTTSVEDNLFELANSNTAADTLDIGIYGNYDDGLSDGGASEYTGLFRDASDSTWKLFDGLEETPTTTINTSGTGFGLADLQVGDLTATTLTATNGLTGSSITYPTSDGTSGQAIITDGSGGLSFGTVSASTDGIITSGTTTIIQSQDDTNVIHVNNSAEVQIGTATSNDRKFTVKGSGDLMQLRSTNSGAGGAQLDLIHESSSPADGDNVGIINFSDNTKQYASVKGIASNTNVSGELHLGVRTDGSNYNATAVVIDSSGNMLFNGSANITSNTSDGSDNGQITISGGGSTVSADTRGASIHISGNENGNGGLLQLRAGNGNIGGIRMYTAGSEQWRINGSGHFTPSQQHAKDIGGVNAEVRNIYAQGLYIGGSAAANQLDDYEEGTWTPALDNVTTNSSTMYGIYTKIGNICHIHAKIAVTLSSLPGANWQISGLPFTSLAASDSYQRAIITIGGDCVNLGGHAIGKAHFRTSGTVLQGVYLNSGTTAYWTYNTMDSTTIELNIHGHYTTT